MKKQSSSTGLESSLFDATPAESAPTTPKKPRKPRTRRTCKSMPHATDEKAVDVGLSTHASSSGANASVEIHVGAVDALGSNRVSPMRKGPKKSRKRRASADGWKDPCAPPPHPLGYRFLEERAPLRATPFSSVIPTVVAKYGFGRRLAAERFLVAWHDALDAVFGAFDGYGSECFDDYGAPLSSRVETFRKFTRPGSLRGGVLYVEVASNLFANELQFQLPNLLRELRVKLPNEKIDRIKIVVR